jgi:carbon storage regulator CsrA
MLVLSRRSQESVVMGGGGALARVLKVTVLGVSGGRVTLGFDVDGDIPVHRLEIWERMREAGELRSLDLKPSSVGERGE